MEINKIHNEDCLHTMSKMTYNSVDFIITSPPYNICADKYLGNGAIIQDYRNWLKKVIRECIRVTKYHVFFNIQELNDIKTDVDFVVAHYAENKKETLIWNKPNAMVCSDNTLKMMHELIIGFSKDKPESRTWFYLNKDLLAGTVLNLPGNIANRNQLHKAQFPINLPRILLNTFCPKGSLIYDPFMGMATTAKACIQEGYNYIGSEINETFYNLSLKEIYNFKVLGQTIQFE